MNEEISVEAANGAIDNLINDIHKLQEPKTPTKEQIDKVADKVKEMLHIPDPRTIALVAILEWEKIRNQQ